MSGRLAIPASHARAQRVQGDSLDWTECVVFLRIPNVSHRRVAITNVYSIFTSYTLSHSVTRADHEVEPRQVKRLDRRGKQRQKIPIVSVDAGNSIQRGSHNRMRFDEWGNLSRFVKERVDSSSRKHFEKGFENFFTATHSV